MAVDTQLLDRLRDLLLEAARAESPGSALPVGATAAEFAAVRFGGPTEIRRSLVTAGVTAVRLVGNNPRRVFWIAVNNGTANGNVGNVVTVTTLTDIVVIANGGAISMDVQEDGEAVAWEWFVITSAASQQWTVYEVERV